MKPSTHARRLQLEESQLVRLTDACGTQIACRAGTLWITVDGELDDVVIERGQTHVLRTRQPVIVQALSGPARAALHLQAGARCRPTLAERLLRVLRELLPRRAAGAA